MRSGIHMGHSGQVGRLAIAVSLGLALLTGGATVAAAQVIEFEIAGGTHVSMQVPKGYCHFDPDRHEADRKYVALSAEGLRPDNKLLAAFADCAAVNAARAAWPEDPYPALERWVQILAPLADHVVSVNTFTNYDRRGTFDALVAETKAIVGDLIRRNENK